MPIEIKVDEQHDNILWHVFTGEWTWEDYFSSVQQLSQLISEHSEIVHIILSMNNTNIPKSPSAFQYARQAAKLYPPNTGRSVVLTDNMLIASLTSAGRKIIQTAVTKQLYTASTVEEAYAIIKEAEKEHPNNG